MEVFLEQINIDLKRYSFLNKSLLLKIKDYAHSLKEEESCGLIIESDIIEFLPCENLSEQKHVHFLIDNKILIENKALCVYHSHVNSGPFPSEMDKLFSDELCIPFLIYSLSEDSFFVYENVGV